MKTWKFKIREYGPVGSHDRILEVVGRTESAALKRVYEMQGDRTWDIFPLGKVA